ncbi:hypothetical protein F2Q68_00037268, partial [Brassica cretica]
HRFDSVFGSSSRILKVIQVLEIVSIVPVTYLENLELEPSLLLYKLHPALIVVPPHPDPGLLLYKIYLHKGKQTQYAFPVISDKKLKKLESKEILALQAAKTEPLKDDHDAFTVVMGSKASGS